MCLYSADYFTFTIAKARINEAKNQEVKEYFTDCVFLWAFTLLENQRYGSHEFRAAVQKQISALSAELVTRSVVATDALALPSHLIGSPFASPDGDGFKEYLSLLYSRKDAFTNAKHLDRILY